MIIIFPFVPSRVISPNSRKDRWEQARVTAKLREDAYIVCKQYHVRFASCRAWVRFSVADPNRPRDWDNSLRTMKPVWDGMKDAGVIVDDNWKRLLVYPQDPLYVKGKEQTEVILEERV